jgi:hypothetical protein
MTNNSIAQDKKRRLDDTFKVLLTIFTVLISVSLGFYKQTSPEMAIMLFFFYGLAVGLWCTANLIAGEYEYLLKFLSWYILLGGIFQSSLMLYAGTLNLDDYYYATNWVAAIFIYYLIFRYVKSFIPMKETLKCCLILMILLGIILSMLKFSGLF